MHVLFTMRMDTEKANQAARGGKLGQTIAKILEQLKPEAAYFGDSDGKRTAFLIVNMDGAHQIPAIAEPWFLAFDASVSVTPVMTPDDLAKAAPDIEHAAKTYRG